MVFELFGLDTVSSFIITPSVISVVCLVCLVMNKFQLSFFPAIIIILKEIKYSELLNTFTSVSKKAFR